MRPEVTAEKLAKLPTWAREHIRDLRRQRDIAVRELNEWVDEQTESPIYIDEMVCAGEEQGPSMKRRYIQGYQVTVEIGDVRVNVSTPITARDEQCIYLQWYPKDRGMRDVAMIPESFCRVRLCAKENMR